MKKQTIVIWLCLLKKRNILSWVCVGVSCGLVAYVFTNTVMLNTIQSRISYPPEKHCYVRHQQATRAEPYTVDEYIELTMRGDGQYTGIKRGTQSGPDMVNSYSGTLLGSLNEARLIQVVFDYTIEGSRNREIEIYRMVRGSGYRGGFGRDFGISKLRYPLVERGGILTPDTDQKYFLQRYARVVCEKQ